ncbi:Ig-like domain-containing protein [Streptomyces malaysiensis subsp. malaysiensis]|uniref:Ig-like domain-containing protein n=1 Tax=Streptomyces malaysiensis TaxID=92644 RepID=UPI0024BFDBC9|nr:Ig-like domain-containing protein [Streptomyces sp. NA07423]WHX19537.1 Ig-like domain-containing protein [Streptomyces sp. NA07423]
MPSHRPSRLPQEDPLTGIDRVDWRPKTYWHKGTKATLQAHLSGVNTGDSRYLRRDGEGRAHFGRTNMRHGCVDMSLADGKWFYNRATQGDIVQITAPPAPRSPARASATGTSPTPPDKNSAHCAE